MRSKTVPARRGDYFVYPLTIGRDQTWHFGRVEGVKHGVVSAWRPVLAAAHAPVDDDVPAPLWLLPRARIDLAALRGALVARAAGDEFERREAAADFVRPFLR